MAADTPAPRAPLPPARTADPSLWGRLRRARRKLGVLALLLVVAAGATWLRQRKLRLDAEWQARRAFDAAIAEYVAAHDLAALARDASDALPAPTTSTPPVLPITLAPGAVADWIYDRLDAPLRADTVAAARTLVLVELDATTLYRESGAIGGGVTSAATLTWVDVATRRAFARRRFSAPPPPQTATADQIDVYATAFWAPIAESVAALPAR